MSVKATLFSCGQGVLRTRRWGWGARTRARRHTHRHRFIPKYCVRPAPTQENCNRSASPASPNKGMLRVPWFWFLVAGFLILVSGFLLLGWMWARVHVYVQNEGPRAHGHQDKTTEPRRVSQLALAPHRRPLLLARRECPLAIRIFFSRFPRKAPASSSQISFLALACFRMNLKHAVVAADVQSLCA